MELSRDDVRKPDQVTAQLKRGFTWTTQHSTAVSIAAGLFLVAGLIWAVWGYWQNSQETELQEKYYEIERNYLQTKEKFDQYRATANTPPNPQNPAAGPQGTKPSGDLQQDYGSVIPAFEALIQSAPKSQAAAMSALSLAEIYQAYDRHAQALEALKLAGDVKGTLGALVRLETGTQLANTGDCTGAITQWNSILNQKSAAFLAPQTKLKIAICSESLGQTAQAEDYYKQVIADAKETAAGRNAEKFLRQLKGSTP